MGVHGLWKLLEPSGKMIPLETLAGKVLAIDVSIWLHQAIKGMHDTHGAPVATAHLLILFHRICKLLYYKIKPIFVFDGGVPALKQLTMAARRRQSNTVKTEAVKIREKLIKNLLKHEAVRQVLANETASAALGLNSFTLPGPSIEEDLYKLPPIAVDYEKSSDEQESDNSEHENENKVEDIHSIDVTSKEFLNLPPEVRHDILSELMETRKQNSWKHLDSMPKESDSFSNFQMSRLLKRHAVKISLEKAGKEMGGKTLSLQELESMLSSQGVLNSEINLTGKRIAQDNVTQYMLIQNNQSNNNEENAQEDKQEVSEKFDIMNHLEDVEWSSESDTDIILENCKKKKSKKIEVQEEKSPEARPSKLPASGSSLTGSSKLVELPKIRLTEEIADILNILEDDNVEKDLKIKVENLQNKLNLNYSAKENVKTDVDNVKFNVSSEEQNQIEKNVEFLNLKKKISPKSLVDTNISVGVFKDCEIDEIESNIMKDEECTNSENNSEMETIGKLDVKTPKDKSTLNNENLSPEDSSNSCLSECESVVIETNDRIQCDNEKMHNIKSPKNIISTEFKSSNLESVTFTFSLNPENDKKDDIFADVFENDGENSVEMEKKKEWEEDENLLGEFKKIINKNETEFEEQISKRHLAEWKKSLDENQKELIIEHGKRERHALNLTDQMYLDAQDLLKLFGIPFVIAPMEAEAQCAVLNALGLTDGTITDDSDIWLFGGGVVYKNFFNQNKYVLEYKSDNIKKYFKLGREDLIKMAYLVGSDYTLGLNGIGPVTALEILAAFPGTGESLLESLEKFRDWFTGKNKNTEARRKLRNKIKNTVMLQGFPNKAVAEAYLRPQVDNSTEPFSWAKPNLDLIREFAKSKMGWSFDKAQELLLPVLRKLDENKSQSTLEKFFKKVEGASLTLGTMSKRVENAVRQLGGEEIKEPKPKIAKERKRKKKTSMESLSTDDVGNFEKEEDAKPKRKRKPIKKNSSEYFLERPIKIEKKENLSNSRECTSNFFKEKFAEDSKIKMINEKLHRVEKIPQKEKAQTLLEERKKEAVKIFKTYKGKGKKKIIIYSKKEANLSESSSDNDG